MSKTENACPTVGAVGQAVETGPDFQTGTHLHRQSTTSSSERQPFRIADLLLPGAKNAIPRRDLMSLTGFTDRELRRQIEAERRLGTPILSDCLHGYFLPGDSMERDRCVRSLRRRAGEIMETAAAIEQAEVWQDGRN